MKRTRSNVKLIMSLYVDDIKVKRGNVQSLRQLLSNKKNEFEMFNLGEMKYFLGKEIN